MALLLLLALLVASSVAEAASDASPCRAALPHGPSVPAPVVLRNSCGGFLLERNGELRRLSPGWFAARSTGTGRRYGADLRIERTRPGRFVLRRHGELVWRSSGLYRNDGGSIAFGPSAFAFGTYRGGVFLTDLRSPERLVVGGPGVHPLEFLRDGSLLVVKYGRDDTFLVVSPSGVVVREYRYRARNGYAFDYRSESLYFVTRNHQLMRMEGAATDVVRPLRGLDGWIGVSGRHLTLSHFTHRGRGDAIRFAVLRRDGRLVSRWSWRSPEGAGVDFGPVASLDGRSFVFRTVTRPRGAVVLYLRRHGAKRPTPVFRHRGAQLGCGVNTQFSWHGHSVLYTATDGPAVIVDAHTGTARSLAGVVAELPRGWPADRTSVSWLRDYPRP